MNELMNTIKVTHNHNIRFVSVPFFSGKYTSATVRRNFRACIIFSMDYGVMNMWILILTKICERYIANFTVIYCASNDIFAQNSYRLLLPLAEQCNAQTEQSHNINP